VLVVGALGYVRAPKRASRVTALLGSAVLGVVVSFGVNALFWRIWPVYFAVLHAPAIASVVLKRLSHRKRSAL
jgi:hypothetical protein